MEIGSVLAEGTSAIAGVMVTGGGSGGGSINIFTEKIQNIPWSISIRGGLIANATETKGGAGGNGSATIGTIANGTFSLIQ